MDEFNLNDFGGTSINNLKNNNLNDDIDFDNILNNLKMSETEDDTKKMSNCSSGLCGRPQRPVDMTNFAKNINTNLDKMYDDTEPQPINYNKQMEKKDNLNKILPKEIYENNDKNNESEENIMKTLNNYYTYFKNNYSKVLTQDIVIYSILFLLLNNNFVVNLLYRIVFIYKYEKYHLNLLVRTLLFLILMFLIKYKLLNTKK